MSRIRSHSFHCLHVCMSLTSWLHRWTWHPLLYQGGIFNREAGLIVLSLGVGLFQVINFSLLFYKLHSGYIGWCAVYICHLRRIKLEFHWRTDAPLWSTHGGCCIQGNMVTVAKKVVENGLTASKTFHYVKSNRAIKMFFHHNSVSFL